MGKRRIVQALVALLYNLNIKNFFDGTIYQGKFKQACVPGLNCYSCPGAVGSCPIGSLQATIGAVRSKVSVYVVGLLAVFGVIFGRLICGWACPFGLIQELLHKIPFRKLGKKRIFGVLKYGKYVMLVVFVFLLPTTVLLNTGIVSPTFCKYVCPAGTLEAGIPLVTLNASLQSSVGWLFSWKVLILVAVVVLSMFIYRPFCRFLCPLGAIYALFNKISIFGLRLDNEKCLHCGACTRACKINLDPSKKPNQPECVNCGECVKACPSGALKFGAIHRK